MKKEMKKISVCLCIIIAISLIGCGNSSKDSKKETTQTVEKSNTDEKSGKSKYQGDDLGYLFTAKETEIAIHADAKKIVSELGEPLSYYEAPSCAFGDMDKSYTYAGFEMDTYSLENTDYVSAIIFTDDTVNTKEGICIGDSMDKVKSIYGDVNLENNVLIYKKGNMKLCFFIENDAVKGIQYLNTVLD